MKQEVSTVPARYYEIDLLRFLAAFSVLLFHYTFRGYAADHLSPVRYVRFEPVSKYGYLGVELFFIISGYVVLLSAQKKTVQQFLISRIARLYPAFWIACTATFLVTYFFGPTKGSPYWSVFMEVYLRQYLYNMTMLQFFFGQRDIDGVYWTLTYEILFYFIISLLLAYRLMPHLPLILAGWLLYVVVATTTSADAPFNTLFFPAYCPLFIAGMLFYLIQQQPRVVWKLYALLLVSWGLAIRNALGYAHDQSAYYYVTFSPIVVGVVISLFYVLFWLIASRRINLHRFAWLAWLGALTYPLYLIHHNIGYILFQKLGTSVNPYGLLIGVTACMLVAAYMVHTAIEQPMSNWIRRKWQQRLRRPNQSLVVEE